MSGIKLMYGSDAKTSDCGYSRVELQKEVWEEGKRSGRLISERLNPNLFEHRKPGPPGQVSLFVIRRSALMNNKQIDELFQLLEKYEVSIATLYETFASVLPESKNAWIVFAEEEHLHAKWINKLYTYVKDGRIQLEQTKFTSQSTQIAINYIENQIDETLSGKPDLKQFLNIAINIEKSLLESAFFKVFKLTAPKAQKIRTQLEEATRSHIEGLINWRERIVKA